MAATTHPRIVVKPEIKIPAEAGAVGRSGSPPVVEFLFFHKAIRAELARLHQDAMALEDGSETDIEALWNRYHFLRAIYKHHSRAEDEVIFPALDLRVKNVAHTYSLEHQVECRLFDQMHLLLTAALKEREGTPVELRRELVCCTEAIQTTLCQHFSKEEEQVFPLLMEHFTFEEQADLVWQFLCSIPVNLMEKFLPWLATSLTLEERQQMTACLEEIVPEERLLQQVVFAWLEGAEKENQVIGSDVMVSSAAEFVPHAQIGIGVIDGNLSPCVKTGMLDDCKSIDISPRKLCEMDIGQDLSAKPLLARSSPFRFPINEMLYWHNAIRKELKEFVEETRQLKLLGVLSPLTLSSFVEKLQFLAEVCIFHSTAEDKVLFPAVNEKVQNSVRCALDHAREEQQFDDVRRLVEGLQSSGTGSEAASQLFMTICTQAESMVKSIRKHLQDEEKEVLPLARKHFSVEEQRSLLYQSIRVMPLKLLERVLPWLMAVLSEDEARSMFQNMCLAAPLRDEALVTLFTGWACKGRSKRVSSTEALMCISARECAVKKCKEGRRKDRQVDKEFLKATSDSVAERPSKRPRSSKDDDLVFRSESDACMSGIGACGESFCCVPALGYGGMRAISTASSLRSVPKGSSSPLTSGSMGSGLFGSGCSGDDPGTGSAPKPIDHIFQFHKAIRKDLEYLDAQSAQLANCSDEFVRDFSGRFQFMRGLYRAHSNAEDEIVFPALEAKEALHNVSHSYTIDHKQEEQLLNDISDVLQELSLLHSSAQVGDKPLDEHDNNLERLNGEDIAKQQRDLAGKLQRMCKSVRVSLDQHVSREELELWPLFDVHFTIEEQDKLVGQIIGTTGAEVLQAMLPWVTTALSKQEKNTMMDTWRQATRNTMFDKWLSAWWNDASTTAPQLTPQAADSTTPPSGSNESLQIVASYLETGGLRSEGSSGDDYSSEPVDMEKSEEKEKISPTNAPDGAAREDEERHSHHISGKGGADSAAGIEEKSKFGDGGDTFKPGWRDIFRMNQKELEAAIRKVSRDASLDPRQKAYLIQNLMTSRWIVAQQQQPNDSRDKSSDEPTDLERCVSYHDEGRKVYGCAHYQRNCKIKAACCGLLTTCRFCHDEVSDHSMDRHATKEMMCMNCLQVQPVAQRCSTSSCNGYMMAKYYCNICKFFNNDERDIYHCPFCNLCRVGKGLGQDFFHCMKCNSCMSKTLANHKCREKGLESDCPICHDFLFTSNTPVRALPCGHFMHSACFQAYTSSNYTCPICSKSIGDMTSYFGMLDALLAAEQLPDEYRSRRQDVLCNDCERKGTAPFHWLYHKCEFCRSYNTRTI